MSKNKMPSEHRIGSMEPGETKHIVNDFGTFVLIKVPFEKDEILDVELADYAKTVDALCNYIENINQGLIDGAHERNQDHANDQR
jgi:hypothetical protein